MKSFLPLCAALLFLVFAGCATTSSGPEHAKTPAQAAAPVGANNGKPGSGSSMLPGSAEVSTLPEGEFRLQIESTPSDSMVVVNGIPVGRTPRTIELAGTSKGFFRDQVSVKVRFIATDATHASQTVEELLTPLDRIPAVVQFSPAGAIRVAK